MKRPRADGFTLIEILLVLAITGFLTGIVLASTTVSRAKARDTRRVSDMKEIQLGLALYYEVNKAYPSGTGMAPLGVLVTDKYLPELPSDPGGGTYEYASYNGDKSYCIGAKLDDVSSAPNDNVTTNATCNTALPNSNYRSVPNI
ncbi:MAG TPA: prepilin-type N-terminal cleavage/methylation domain-containing protein [Candidatus Paceibacterota bacterium]|nr:prepilin-type N-terminal cleavage/methylation domain-containing protein [Candidatus Paceibacterota bacterium]